MKLFIRDQLKAVATKEQVEENGSRMAKNEERIIENAESIVRTTETVSKLRDSIAKIEQEIISERRGLEERVEHAVEDAMKKDGKQQWGIRGADEPGHDEFELARRSLADYLGGISEDNGGRSGEFCYRSSASQKFGQQLD